MDSKSIAKMIQSDLENDAPYLSFDFKLNEIGFPTSTEMGNKSIIWAPNGTCKSTIYQSAKSFSDNRLSITCISYEDDAEFEGDYFVSGKKGGPKRELLVSPGTNEINSLSAERHSIVQSFNLKEALKASFGITTVGAERLFFHEAFKKAGVNGARNTSDEDQAKAIGHLLDTSAAQEAEDSLAALPDEDRGFFLRHYPELKLAQAQAGWTDEHREIIRREILRRVSSYVFDRDTTCPVCGAEHAQSIKSIINSELNILRDGADKLHADFFTQVASQNPSPDEMASIEARFEALRALALDVKEESLFSYAVRAYVRENSSQQDDSQDIDDFINDQIARLRGIRNRIKKCEQKRSRFYRAVQCKKDSIESIFLNKFSANITFDDDKCLLSISLPRDIQSYSTGEKNLMVFMIRLMAYRGDKTDVLIIDDPLSSYDSANQYSIMFELIELASDIIYKDSSILILTHNMKCVSIAESQRQLVFKYYILDKLPSTTGGSHPIQMSPLPLEKLKNKGKIFTLLSGLSSADGFADSLSDLMNLEGTARDSLIDRKFAFIRADRDREHVDPSLSELFHYNKPFSKTYQGITLKNENLVQYIDSFNMSSITPVSQGIAHHWLDKIYCTLALRVWIEKQLFDNVDPSVQNAITNKRRYIDKVDYVFPANVSSKWKGSGKITRDFLLSQKALINQSEHIFSQPVPYEYCLNISTNDLYDIVERIKSRF